MPDQPPTPESPWGREPPTGPEWASYDPTRPSPTRERPPSGGGRAVLVALLVVGLLAVVGIVATVVVLTGDDDVTPSADPGTSSAPTSTSSETATETATDTPTVESPSEPVTSDPPSSDPSTPDAPVDPDSPFSYTEYGDDWDFRIGDVALQADFQQGWDYPDCTDVEVGDALTSIGCVRASEWTLRALDGKLAMTHLVLTFDSEAAAKRAVDQGLLDADSFTVEPEGLLGGDASTGTFKGDNVTGMPYVVLTVETHAPEVRQAKADEFLGYGTADIVAALGFRF